MGRGPQIALAGIFTLGLVALGCSHKAPNTVGKAAPPPASEGAAPTPAATPASAAPAQDTSILSQDIATLNSRGYLKDAYFDFDRATLRTDARTALAQDARWLAKYPSIQVVVEGHCDDRGTEEYNLALGDKRDGSVKEYLAELGVPESRIHTVSYGKDRPFCSENSEQCWQANRRGHFVITAK
ncbi:MAG TPA: peptidoglycan-associated lipoprotein Pal [Thermoanaerobaculia bacterium]|nr:peptidoglycan-associated lipoprotein Pal [Thermoanaerobaculia bacterium]